MPVHGRWNLPPETEMPFCLLCTLPSCQCGFCKRSAVCPTDGTLLTRPHLECTHGSLSATATPPALCRMHCTVSCLRSLLACTFLGGRNNTPLSEALEMVPKQGPRQTAEPAPPTLTEQTSRAKPGLEVQRGAFCHQTQADCCSPSLGHADHLCRSQGASAELHTVGNVRSPLIYSHLQTPSGSQEEEESSLLKKASFPLWLDIQNS